MEFDRRTREILRYLGGQNHKESGKEAPDASVLELISSCVSELEKAVSPKHCFREFPLKLNTEELNNKGLNAEELNTQKLNTEELNNKSIDGGCFKTRSKALQKNLKDCENIIVFAATLGTGADYLLARYTRVKMSRAVVLQAAAAALLEEYCNQVCVQMAEEYEKKGWFLRPRFSPGYGDFPLEVQPQLLDALEAGKRLGIKLTDSFLMLPSKSITAVMGVSRIPKKCRAEGCEACLKTDCLYRR